MITITPEDLELLFWVVVVAFIASQFIYDVLTDSIHFVVNFFKKD